MTNLFPKVVWKTGTNFHKYEDGTYAISTNVNKNCNQDSRISYLHTYLHTSYQYDHNYK